MDWFFALWLSGMGVGAWVTRKKQDERLLSQRLRDRFGLHPHYYEHVTTGLAVVCVALGIFYLAKASGIL